MLHQYNARQMYKFNGTSEFAAGLLPSVWKLARGVACQRNSAGIAQQQKLIQAEYDTHHAEQQLKGHEECTQPANKHNTQLDALELPQC